jgi:hypothetical protein
MSLGLIAISLAVDLPAISHLRQTSSYFVGPIAIGSRFVVWPNAKGHSLAINLPATMGIIFCGTDCDRVRLYFSLSSII